MTIRRTARGTFLPLAIALLAPLVLTNCSDRQTPPPPAATTPTPAPAPTMTPPATSSGSVVPPATATDVESKKGTETGMIGGESGTVSSSGKPGSGTAGGAGTGPAVSSGEQTVNQK